VPDGGFPGRADSLLLELASQQATGCLTLTDRDGEQATVWFRDGLVYAVSVPGRRPLLGVRLMSSGALTPEGLSEALEVQRTELQGWRLGELLVHLGFVDRVVVESFVTEQVRDQVADLLHWDVSTRKFRNGKRTRQDVAPPIEVTDLLELAQQRDARWAEIVPFIVGADGVPVLSTSSDAAPDVVLGPYDWALLCKVDGTRTIADLADDCGFTVFEAGMVVVGLLDAGLVEIDNHVEDEDVWTDSWTDDQPTDDEVAASVARVAATLHDMNLGPSSQSPFSPRPVASEYAPLSSQADAKVAPRRSPFAAAPVVEEQLADVVSLASEREARDEAERLEAERLARQERDREAAERAEVERLEAEELEREAAERAEAERLEAERLEAERLEAERLEAERLEAERLEREEQERLEAERLEAERLEAERLEREEQERLEAERLEAERLEREEQERLEAERLEAERLEAERLEAERLEAERLEAERLEAERLEAERLEREEQERLEAERLAREEQERLEREAAERAEAERLEAERLEREEQERLEAERLEAERLEAERIEREEQERLEAERLEAERIEAERIEREEQERLEREAAERAEAERLEAERLEAERLEAERLAREEQERLEAERLEREEQERFVAASQLAERIAREAGERVEAERAEAARIEAALIEAARIERLEHERAQAELQALGMGLPVPSIETPATLDRRTVNAIFTELALDAPRPVTVEEDAPFEETEEPSHSLDISFGVPDSFAIESTTNGHAAGPHVTEAPAYAEPQRDESPYGGSRVAATEFVPAAPHSSGAPEGADMAALLRELSSLGGGFDSDNGGGSSTAVVGRPVQSASREDKGGKKKKGFFSR
jgi:hypothetical protein